MSMPTPGLPFKAQMPVMPQDDVLPATLDTLYQYREDIDQVLVVVEMGQGADNPQWLMSTTQRDVLLDSLLQFMPEKPQPEDLLWPKLKKMDPKYKGFRIVMRTVWGRNIAPMTIFEGKVSAENGATLAADYGRRMEYWMFGTSRVRRDQMVGASVLPVITFEQCRLLGQPIVYTRPRQCLLPDNNLLLETSEMPTLQSARITTFDECLVNGKALIYTFPRRCVAAGGRVFTEPPRVYEMGGAPVADVPVGLQMGMGTSATDPTRQMQLQAKLRGDLVPSLPSSSLAVSGTGTPVSQ